MRSFFVLLFLGVVLATIAIVVRSGMIARKNPGQPINGAMRVALGTDANQWTDTDNDLVARVYNGALDDESGIRYLIRKPGKGTATPQKDQIVTVNFEGRLLETEAIIESSSTHEGPYNFRFGEGLVMTGWEAGIKGMRKGEKRTLIIPYWLGYGDKGIRGRIPRRATLVYDIELVDFKSVEAAQAANAIGNPEHAPAAK